MNSPRLRYTVAATFACASVAAVIGIASGAAAPSKGGSATDSADVAAAPVPPPGRPPLQGMIFFRHSGKAHGGHERMRGGPPVHSEMVVPTRSGKDFETMTQDSGKVDSISGNQLTITEGTEEATYKTVTVDIPGDAKVIRNGEAAELGDLQEGDQVDVSQSPQHSFVFASDQTFTRKLRMHGPLPPPPSAAGLPPGLPPMPLSRPGH